MKQGDAMRTPWNLTSTWMMMLDDYEGGLMLRWWRRLDVDDDNDILYRWDFKLGKFLVRQDEFVVFVLQHHHGLDDIYPLMKHAREMQLYSSIIMLLCWRILSAEYHTIEMYIDLLMCQWQWNLPATVTTIINSSIHFYVGIEGNCINLDGNWGNVAWIHLLALMLNLHGKQSGAAGVRRRQMIWTGCIAILLLSSSAPVHLLPDLG